MDSGSRTLDLYTKVYTGLGRSQAAIDRNTLTVGYDHYLSKRTDVYLMAMRDKLDGLSAGASHSLGVRHRF